MIGHRAGDGDPRRRDLVRMVLVPATMELLGDANWWLPHWLDRRLPQFHLEGPTVAEAA